MVNHNKNNAKIQQVELVKYHTQQVKFTGDEMTRSVLQFLCETANRFENTVLYSIRRNYFEKNQDFYLAPGRDDQPRMYRKSKAITGVSCPKLWKQFKTDSDYSLLGGQQAQQAIKSVVERVNSYNGLRKAYFNGTIERHPNLPGYRTSSGLAPITFPGQAVRFDVETGDGTLAISRENKSEVAAIGVSKLTVNGGYGFNPEDVIEVRILPKLGEFYVEYVYFNRGVRCPLNHLDRTQALGIDHGRDNWLTCVSTLGKSFIIDGRKLKSLNLRYNKRVAQLKSGKPEKYWDAELDRVTTQRNHQMRDAINKTARFLVNHCLANKIGTVVFGWNPGQKVGANMSRVQNQQFVQIPTGRLKERIRQLCEEYGIRFVETEEAYTSKASFLDGDSPPRHGEKPSQWKPSGKRVQRGLYRASNGQMVNADCNGAANIIAKVSTQLGITLAKVSKGVLNLPKRYSVFSDLTRLYRGVADRISSECGSH